MQMLPKDLQAFVIRLNQKQLNIKREIQSIQNYPLHQMAIPNPRIKMFTHT